MRTGAGSGIRPHEVHGGPQAVIGELQVLPGIPRRSGDVVCVRRLRLVAAHGFSSSRTGCSSNPRCLPAPCR